MSRIQVCQVWYLTRSGPDCQKEANFHDLPERIFSLAEPTLKCSGYGLEEATRIQRKIPVFSRPYFKLAGIRNLLKEGLFPKAKIFQMSCIFVKVRPELSVIMSKLLSWGA